MVIYKRIDIKKDYVKRFGVKGIGLKSWYIGRDGTKTGDIKEVNKKKRDKEKIDDERHNVWKLQGNLICL